MRKLLVIIFFSLHPIILLGQISFQLNTLRAGDKLVKQQVNYIEAGPAGEGRVWDMRNLSMQGKEYSVEYSTPKLHNDSIYIMGQDTFPKEKIRPNELIIALEHHTAYYYHQTDSCVTLIGFENPVTLTHNTGPAHQLYFPSDSGRSELRHYISTNIYSLQKVSHAQVSLEVSVDGRGMIILPSGDSLRDVIRVKMVQTSIPPEQEHNIAAPLILEAYKWYASGYRYPILESVSTRGIEANASRSFASSFFFPPDRHFYYDDENAEIKTKSSERRDFGGNINPWKNDWCCYPNPVIDKLRVEYSLKEATSVLFRVYDASGLLLHAKSCGVLQAGIYSEHIDLSHFTAGNYIIEMVCGETIKSQVILKR